MTSLVRLLFQLVAKVMLRVLGAVPIRILMRFSKFERWFNNQVSKCFFGALPEQSKLWRELRSILLKRVEKRIGAKARTIMVACSGLRVRGLPHTELQRKFIIALVDMPRSMQAAQRALESAARYGETLEIMPGVSERYSRAFFKEHDLTWHRKYSPLSDNSFSAMGCFASHYKLWLYCAETQHPIGVFEHDIELVRPIPALRFKDVIYLGDIVIDPRFRFPKILEAYYPWDHIRGANAYAITPEGARKLIDQASKLLLPPVDSFMHKRRVDILGYSETLVKDVQGISTIRSTRDNPDWRQTGG